MIHVGLTFPKRVFTVSSPRAGADPCAKELQFGRDAVEMAGWSSYEGAENVQPLLVAAQKAAEERRKFLAKMKRQEELRKQDEEAEKRGGGRR